MTSRQPKVFKMLGLVALLALSAQVSASSIVQAKPAQRRLRPRRGPGPWFTRRRPHPDTSPTASTSSARVSTDASASRSVRSTTAGDRLEGG